MTSENLLTLQGLLIISNRNSLAQGLPCLMKSAELCSENFEKIAIAQKRCIIVHFYKVVMLKNF